jgi:hypothetical protein
MRARRCHESEQLQELEAALQRATAPVLDVLAPGASRKALRWMKPGMRCVCDCSSGAGPILYVEPSLPEPAVRQVPTHERMIVWLTEAYDAGAWTRTDQGWRWDPEKVPEERRESARYLL